MLVLPRFEIYSGWVPGLDGRNRFAWLTGKKLEWFDRARFRLQKFETCPDFSSELAPLDCDPGVDSNS